MPLPQAQRHRPLRITFYALRIRTRHPPCITQPTQYPSANCCATTKRRSLTLSTQPGRPVNPGKDQVLVPPSRGSPPTKRSIPSSILAAGQAGHGAADTPALPLSRKRPRRIPLSTRPSPHPRDRPPARRLRPGSHTATPAIMHRPKATKYQTPNNPTRVATGNAWRVPFFPSKPPARPPLGRPFCAQNPKSKIQNPRNWHPIPHNDIIPS
jgi:hypothetical protein